jgi:hypothetical protein
MSTGKRHPEPERMRLHREKPRFCHTCDRYRFDGVCEKYGSVPPEEFAATENACEHWEDELIPF